MTISKKAPWIFFHLALAALHGSKNGNGNGGALVEAFTGIAASTKTKPTTTNPPLHAAPRRLAENVDGVVYVNDKCINCAACSSFAPSVFQRATTANAHIVHHQPETDLEIHDARAAMAACPVAAIRTESLAQRKHRQTEANVKQAVQDSWTDADEGWVQLMAMSPKLNGLDLPFPRRFWSNDTTHLPVYYVGHHNDRSFGAVPYLVQAKVDSRQVWIMVDTPRFGKPALDAVKQITGNAGPDFLVLTHVDDTADHGKWAAEFTGTLKRIFHAGDTGRYNWLRDRTLEQVEILLPRPPEERNRPSLLNAYAMNGTLLPDDWWKQPLGDDEDDVVILHTPGHSPGSITLWKKPNEQQQLPGILFTGDTYAYTTRNGGYMSGFPRYGNNLREQAETLRKLLQLSSKWDIVAPGHGHARDYFTQFQDDNDTSKDEAKTREMEVALQELERH